ncbi:MAG: tryptophan synthase subunit beta [Eubacteriales bacterium]|nr:tryptophan synthase subunit beta [Eubacteriales bacterium]MDD4681922.1 tryptophan synthase subunit beta [Eubacteriales bacterium]
MEQNKVDFSVYRKNYPDKNGFFGNYGGAFIPPQLEDEFKNIYTAYETICQSSKFISELRRIRKEFQGRPTPTYHCERLSNSISNCQIYLKREDLNHTGAHKLNHCMGEGLLAKFLGKKKLIAETGAGQHGVALATAAAFFGLECDIYMGEVDIVKQAPNVARMKLLGARVIPVSHGLKTLKEAVDGAFEGYMKEYETAIYCIGSVVGPHPFPLMVRDFQMVVGIEAREQFMEMTGNLPDAVVACVGGGSNAAGILTPFIADPVDLYGVEPMGRGTAKGEHAASLTYGSEGIMHGFRSIMLQDEAGEPDPVYSVASGLDYPSVGPEHAFLRDLGRVKYGSVSDDEAIDAFFFLSRMEGIIPALESAHAVAYAMKLAREMGSGSILVNCSGRGDKDLDYVLENYGDRLGKV